MSRQLLLILIVNLSITTYSQEFAPLNAKWHFGNCYFIDDEPITFSLIKTVGDTVIDNKHSTTIHLFDNNGHTFVTELIIHEEQGKVYFYEANEFKLFFDYNLNEGDTLSYRLPLNAPYFQSNCGGSEVDVDRIYYALIKEITTLEVEGIELLQFHTTIIEPEDYDGSYDFWELGIFTQRIGSPQGLFGKSAVEPLGGYPGYYRCYEDDEISINFFPSSPCDFMTMNITEFEESAAILIYPNPVMTNLNIILFNENCSRVKLIDAQGKIVKSKSMDGLKELEMNLSNIPSGLYILRMEFNGITINRKKILKL